ncbi:hypothetical protein [Flavobacterium sp. I3-2]|uniref:hypothetical protein n=1 Tax=Flavobacterium sp. I3-2 TaxID=2748319 RepID=UPI0015A87B43|nr:hypothetical protein [Flavobacterium sp. I3-2]
MKTISSINTEYGNIVFTKDNLTNAFEFNSTHKINNIEYKSLLQKAKTNINIPIEIIYYYKNRKLKSVNIYIEIEYLKEIYKPNNIDYKDYIINYIEFCENEYRKLLNSLITTRKTNFDWGTIKIQTDPRTYDSFIEIKYNKTPEMAKINQEKFEYIFIDIDGTARELSDEEKSYLSEKFNPNDGARPYIKLDYNQLTPDNKICGFLKRDKLPQNIIIKK